MESWKVIEPYVLNVVPVLFFMALVFTLLRRKQGLMAWKSFALTHGLSHRPPETATFFSKRAAIAFRDPGEVHGQIEGLPFRLYVAIYGTSKDRRIFTIMSVEIPGLPPGLTIYHENLFLKFTKMLGAQDVTTGDPGFDAAFVVKGNDPAAVLNWLNPQRRQAILHHIGDASDIDIREGRLQFQRGQIVDNREILDDCYGKMQLLVSSLQPSF